MAHKVVAVFGPQVCGTTDPVATYFSAVNNGAITGRCKACNSECLCLSEADHRKLIKQS